MTPNASEYLGKYRELSAVLEAWRNGRFWYADKTRLTRADLWLKQSNMMEGWIQRHLRTPVVTLGDAMMHPVWNLIGSVTKQKAVAFKEAPVVELINSRTRTVVQEADYPVVGRLHYLLESDGMWEALESLEELVLAHQTAAIWLRIVDGQVVPQALPPYALVVDVHPQLRADLRRLRGVTVPVTGDAYPDDPEHELRITYQRAADGRILAGYVDPDGQPVPVDLPEAPAGEYLSRRMPVVIWRETASNATWMAPLPHTLHAAQYQLNVYLSQMALAYRMGTYALAVAKQSAGAGEFPARDGGDWTSQDGMRAALSETELRTNQAVRDTGRIRLSGDMTDVIQLTPGWDMDLLQAKVAIQDFTSYVETMLKLAYLAEDLPPTQVDLSHLQPSNVGEASKLVNYQPLEGAKQRREGRLSRQTVETLRVWRDLHNAVCAPEDRIPEELDFRVRFESVWSPGVLTNQSVMQAIQAGTQMGIIDPVKMRASLTGVPESEAGAAFAQAIGRAAYAQGQATK